MSWRCRIGWHDWYYREMRVGPYLVVEARCGRAYCSRYPDWMLVHRELTPF